MKLFATERDLDFHVAAYLKGFGFSVYTQVGTWNAICDIVAWAPDGELWIVEDKLRDWRKVLEQARLHTSFCHHSFVCMPVNAIKPAAIEVARSYGVGVMAASLDSVEIVLKATSDMPWPPGIEKMRSTCEFIDREVPSLRL